jgi:hypothetical protein
MRSIVLVTLLVIGSTLFSACSTFPAGARMSDCPEMEGYPDCQEGHRVRPGALAAR